MAPPPPLLSLLWGLTLLIGAADASVCNVTCTTDYIKKLNCSCSASVPVRLTVNCSSYDTEIKVNCSLQPPQSWCIIDEDLTNVASIGTTCTAATVAASGQVVDPSESSSWDLSSVVKPEAPVDVKVTNATKLGVYNITWRSNNEYCVTNGVRIRNTGDPEQDPIYLDLQGGAEYLELAEARLQPGADYVADVRARFCPDEAIEGPWSEWSHGAEWSTAAAAPHAEQMNVYYWLYVSSPIVLILGLLLLGYLHKPCWQKKLRMITYIPTPNDYFKPLYQNYEGNFKEWVKPVFNEYDYLKITTRVSLSEKQAEILDWRGERQRYSEENEVKDDEDFPHMPQPPDNLLMTFQDSSTSQGTVHSTGHISIHTVTLSGEEFEEEVASQSSLRSYQDGESFGNGERAPYDVGEARASRMERLSGISLRENQIADDLIMQDQNVHPDGELNEAERVSLDSFASNDQSEDGYPHVDLDTIDSGFGECGSPGASDSNSNSFPVDKHLNSNYVKQWMACSTIQEDSSNVNNELNGTQSL